MSDRDQGLQQGAWIWGWQCSSVPEIHTFSALRGNIVGERNSVNVTSLEKKMGLSHGPQDLEVSLQSLIISR